MNLLKLLALVLAGAIALVGVKQCTTSQSAEGSVVKQVAEKSWGHMTEAAASRLVADSLSVELNDAAKLVKDALKVYKINQEASQYGIAGLLAVEAYRRCISAGRNYKDCLLTGYSAVSVGQAWAPEWKKVWDEEKSSLDIIRLCDPIEAQVQWVKANDGPRNAEEKLAIAAWNEASCDTRNRKAMLFWEKMGNIASWLLQLGK